MSRLALLATVVLGALPARAESQNDRVRQEATRPAPSNGSSSSSGSSGSSSGSDSCDWITCLCEVANAFASAPPVTVVEPPPSAPPPSTPPPSPAPRGVSSGPYEVPPAPPEPVRGLVMLGIGRPIAKNLLTVPRAEAFVDLPMDGLAFRLGIEHEIFMEQVPTEAGTPAHWDNLPLSAFRAGFVFRSHRGWEFAATAALRALWLDDGPALGADLGLRVAYEAPAWFLDTGLTAMVIGSGQLVGTEPVVRVGVRVGRAQLGVGWRHLQFFGSEVIPYTGPEASIALRF